MILDTHKVLREARLEAERRGFPATWHAVALILAGWCAALIKLQSPGYLRRGLPPIDTGTAERSIEETATNPTALGDGR